MTTIATVRADLFVRARRAYWRACMGKIVREDFDAMLDLYCRLWHLAGR